MTQTSTATVPAQADAVSRQLSEHPLADRARELIAMHEGTLARLTAKRDIRPAIDRMRDIYTLRIHEVSGWIASLQNYLIPTAPALDYAACPTCATPGGQPCARTCRSRYDDHETAD